MVSVILENDNLDLTGKEKGAEGRTELAKRMQPLQEAFVPMLSADRGVRRRGGRLWRDRI